MAKCKTEGCIHPRESAEDYPIAIRHLIDIPFSYCKPCLRRMAEELRSSVMGNLPKK